MTWMTQRMNISMSAFDRSFGRKEAVQKSAELLRDIRTASFPLNVYRLLSSFGQQIKLVPYAATGANPQDKDTHVSPQMMSRDGFCTRIRDALIMFGEEAVECSAWCVFFDNQAWKSRIRFTLMHELGHICLLHHQYFHIDTLIDLEDNPDYKPADRQADLFSINILAPAPAVYRLLTDHGFSYDTKLRNWQLTNPDAPLLQHLGQAPEAEALVMTAFGLSQFAADWRLSELPLELEIWKQLDPELYALVENLPQRAGWFCRTCHTRRRSASVYCPGCGFGFDYEFRDLGKFPRPVIGLRENGQFEFCSVCGNADLPEGALFCPICGCPVVNECENTDKPYGAFSLVRDIVPGPHRCRPGDIHCETCGAVTAFARRRGPKENMWSLTPGSDRCRIMRTHYPEVIPTENGRLLKCPDCGSTRTMRDGAYCADCYQPLQNVCASGGKGAYACGANDRYCGICGKETIFRKAGWLSEYRDIDEFAELMEAEKNRPKETTGQLLIQNDGEICVSWTHSG